MRTWETVLVALVALVLAGLVGVRLADSLAASTRPARDLGGGDPAQGRRVVAKYGCGACHRIPGVRDAVGRVGPSLARVGEQAYIAGRLPNEPENLAAWIRNPQRFEPGTAMPNLNVSAGDARDIAAYLYTLP